MKITYGGYSYYWRCCECYKYFNWSPDVCSKCGNTTFTKVIARPQYGRYWYGDMKLLRYEEKIQPKDPIEGEQAWRMSNDAKHCEACERGEKTITPPHSSIVGSVAVHTPSGMVCAKHTPSEEQGINQIK